MNYTLKKFLKLHLPILMVRAVVLLPLFTWEVKASNIQISASRIASTTVVADEIIWLLLSQKKEKALYERFFFSSLATNPDYSRIVYDPFFSEIKKFQTLGTGLNLEYLISLKPSLVFASEFNRAELFSTLARFKIPLLKLREAKNFEDIWRDVAQIGESMGDSAAAMQLIQQSKTRLEKIRNCADRSFFKNESVLVYSADLLFAGEGTLWSEVLKWINLKNALHSVPKKGWSRMSDEALLKLNFGLIVIPTTKVEESAKIKFQISKHPAWSRTKAFKQQKFIDVDTSLLSSGSAYVVELAEKICRKISSESGAPNVQR